MRFDNPSNFRPLPRVRPHSLFRSDHLGALNEDDARQIQALGIRRVLDFRGINEREDAVCRLPDVTVHSLAIEPTIVQKISDVLAAGDELTQADVVAMMQDTYRGFVRTNTHRFAEFFAHLLESNEPTVFHCTAGKDRTGFAAALVLHALGAPADEVMRDYMLTNERLKPVPLTATPGRLPRHVAEVLYGVRPEFLEASYQTIEHDYGTIDGYLREGLGIRDAEHARLKALWLDEPQSVSALRQFPTPPNGQGRQ